MGVRSIKVTDSVRGTGSMAVSWGYTMVLVMTVVALWTFSPPLFQLAIPESAVEEHAQTDMDIVSKDADSAVPPEHYHPLASKASAARSLANMDSLLRQRRTRAPIGLRRGRPAPCAEVDETNNCNLPEARVQTQGALLQQSKIRRMAHSPEQPLDSLSHSAPVVKRKLRRRRRSVLASFQSDRMVPTGPNPLHNSNRSQVALP